MSDGRKQIPRNVLSSWGGQAVLIISGFIIPRLIDRGLGQQSLGVWDFAWSLISHFGLIQAGVTGSVNRYVAQFRSKGDTAGLNRSVSSVAGVLRLMGVAILLLTLVCIWAMPALLRESLRSHLAEARWLVLLLGTSLAVQTTASIYGGVLTGCHRWDWHNTIYAVTYTFTLVGMVAVLRLGYGLVGLAAASLAGETLGRLARMVLAYRACSGLEIRWRHMDAQTAREMLHFGGKMFLFDCAYLLLSQTVSVLLMIFLGPASLALFSRPVALIRTVKTFALKYANVFVPTASALQSAGNPDDLKRLTVRAVRYGVFFCLPPLLLLAVLGGNLLELWMGGRYSNPHLMALLVAAHCFSIAHAPLFFVLAGLNRHGRAGVVLLLGAILGVLLTYLWLAVFHGGLAGAAVAFGLPWALVNGIYLPIHACRRLDLSFREFMTVIWWQPLLCCLPFTICLLALRWFHLESPVLTLTLAAVLGGIALSIPYWRIALPTAWKTRLLSRVHLSRA